MIGTQHKYVSSKHFIYLFLVQVELLECTIRPGEAIYFPHGWWHATLNIDTAVFISTFLSP